MTQISATQLKRRLESHPHRFSFRPLCRVDAPAQFGQVRFWNVHMKRTNCIFVICLLAALQLLSEEVRAGFRSLRSGMAKAAA
jgi:hypothetical protein